MSDANMQAIFGIVDSVRDLERRAVEEYQPIVDDILRTRSRDTRHIEKTLDGLLDFCGYEPALQLYKRLCRHYWEIDPAATAYYVNAYREYWDSEDSGDQSSSATSSST